MADDDLSAPLGTERKEKSRPALHGCRSAFRTCIAGVLGLFVLACAAWALLVDDPFGGEPIAVVATGFEPPKSGMPASCRPWLSAQGPRSYDGPGRARIEAGTGPTPARRRGAARLTPPTANPNTKTVTIIDGSTGKRQEVPIPGSRDIRAPLEQRLLETSRHGAIPKIAPDGARPAESMPAPRQPLQGKKDGPRIAIVIGGLGISANVTQQALDKLARAGDARLRALRRRPRAPGDQRPRRGPRGAAAGADGAVRLSRQRSRPADAADLAQPSSRISTACIG